MPVSHILAGAGAGMSFAKKYINYETPIPPESESSLPYILPLILLIKNHLGTSGTERRTAVSSKKGGNAREAPPVTKCISLSARPEVRVIICDLYNPALRQKERSIIRWNISLIVFVFLGQGMTT